MIHYYFNEEHQLIRKTARDFVENDIKPYIEQWEEAGGYPRELFEQIAELGFFGLKFPEEYGGSGPDYLAELIWIEELSRCASGGVTGGLGAHSQIALPPIGKFGDDELKHRFLAPGIDGKKIGALAITEPDNGSDVANIKTRAEKEKDYYIVNGGKTFITNALHCDFAVVAVKTDKEAKHKGISLLVIEKNTPGFSTGQKMDKLGWRASDTSELYFEDCKVPQENLIGKENKGFYYIMQNFQWERIVMALYSVVHAQLAVETALEYSRQREQFGRKIGDFQVIRHYLADMATEVEAARQLTYYAFLRFMKDEDSIKEAAMAKLQAGRVAQQVIDYALQIHGGNGYMMEYPVQRLWRDERLSTIGGGTSEILKEIISGQVQKNYQK